MARETQFGSVGRADDLVIGGAGFIGSHIVDELLERGRTVCVLDDLSLGSPSNLASLAAGSVDLVVGDATDPETVDTLVRRVAPSRIWDLAVIPLPRSLRAPSAVVGSIVGIARNVAEVAREHGPELIHFSSSEVYGSAVGDAMNESHPLAPRTPYAAAKAASDLITQSYVHTFRVRAIVIRPFNTYGPRQNWRRDAAVVPRTIRRGRLKLPAQLAIPGTQTRDFVFVSDVARLAVQLADRGPLDGTVVNVGSGVETPIADVVGAIARGMDVGIERIGTRPADVTRHRADIGRLRSRLGDPALTPLDVGLERTIDWYSRLDDDDARSAQADETARSSE
ncbi:MAG: NAD-dependent epimerase/dehydratase family protein [Elusimicrobia bacterium]|nr:NAD-dependent epimerase/dehydratase family protein [Elusimicrobiota bacterium]